MVLYHFGVSVVRERVQQNPDCEGREMHFIVGEYAWACHRSGYCNIDILAGSFPSQANRK